MLAVLDLAGKSLKCQMEAARIISILTQMHILACLMFMHLRLEVLVSIVGEFI